MGSEVLTPIKISPLRFVVGGIVGLLCLLLPRIFLTSSLEVLTPLAREATFEMVTGVIALLAVALGARLGLFRSYPSINSLPLHGRDLWTSLKSMTLLLLTVIFIVTPVWETVLLWCQTHWGWQVSLEPQGILLLLQESAELGPVMGILLSATVLAPIFEEIGFRYYCYRYFKGLFRGPYGAAILTAWLFAQLHGNLRSFPGLFLFSLLLTWLYERCGNLWPSVWVHAINNALSILVVVCCSAIL